ncbi:ABC transporter ATP-binding protein [Pseudothermotoga thermarum]|uniref:ABC transporter related protein n=1 Tax=Pseudothermotoga thermarum DSM 5069 TaxID=688269 RepID=F7YTG0_9THEM|nr:ABC transporter ATP-binding protein [Pseudothermotoga thermarum]AEH51174.1 ABC transporter related protein [Pseudothermotoga thermarum DSM 5069]
MSDYYVEVRNLTKEFKEFGSSGKVVAVNSITFGVKKGQMVTLLGPSGCGKTTTLRLIGGFEIPTSGEILIDGVVVNDLPPNRRPTAMVFQSYALFPHMNVFQNVAYGLKNKRLPKEKIREKVLSMLAIVGLTGLEKRYPSQLSGGQQQRVALARALVVEPKVLLLDEPLSNLDAKLREQMRIELKKIQKELGITSIYVTHDQLEAMVLSDYIVVMKDGIIMQQDPPDIVYKFPANRFVASFIGKASFIKVLVLKCENKFCKVKLPNGKIVEVPIRVGAHFKENEEVFLMMRPEGGKFVDSDKSMLTGVVITRIFTGSTAYFEVKTDYGILAVEIQNPNLSKLPEINENVGITYDKESMTVVR